MYTSAEARLESYELSSNKKFYRFCLPCHVRFAKSIISNSRNLAQRKFTETKEQLI